MSHGSAWQRQSLAVKQVPTLRKLLRCCDEGLLVRTIVEEHAVGALGSDAEVLTPKRRRTAEKRLRATIATMRGLPLGDQNGPPRFLLPHESFVLHARSGLVERKLSAALVLLDDVADARRIADAGCSAGFDASPRADGGVSLAVRSYTLAPWEDVLAYRMWLGGMRCTRERYVVLAGALWEMTYLGFEYERVCARQQQEKARRLLADEESDGDGAQAASAARHASGDGNDRTVRAVAFGLHEPDRFARDYRECLAARVGELNRACERDFCLRFLDLVNRLEDV